MSTYYMINSKCKSFSKADDNIKKAVINSLDRLMVKIKASGKPLSQIFNDDTVIYDRISNEFFLLKCRVDHLQFRIVYSMEKKDSEDICYLVDMRIKKKNTKSYISDLNDKYKECHIASMSFYKYLKQ